MAGTCVDHDHLRGPLNKSRAGATTAMRDGMRERRRRECDREGWSSTFRRKMRPRSGMHAPSQSIIAVAASPSAARSRFAGPSSNAPGAPFARSLTKQAARKARQDPHVAISRLFRFEQYGLHRIARGI